MILNLLKVFFCYESVLHYFASLREYVIDLFLKTAFTSRGELLAAVSESEAQGVGLSSKKVNTPTTHIDSRTKATY